MNRIKKEEEFRFCLMWWNGIDVDDKFVFGKKNSQLLHLYLWCVHVTLRILGDDEIKGNLENNDG